MTRVFESREVVAVIERLLRARRPDATICPSDVARALAGDDGPWRGLMPQIRTVAATLAREGRLRVTRGGAEVNALSSGGPIRLGSPPRRRTTGADSAAEGGQRNDG